MIFLLQNLLHYTGDYINKKYSKIQSADDYPRQNEDMVGKLIFVPYRDENEVKLNYRLYVPSKYIKFDGINGPYDNYTKILRFDAEEPYVAVLVDRDDKIIVADSRILANYKVYPGYKYGKNYRGFQEAPLTMVDWDIFNDEYNREKLWLIHVQNKDYLGQPAYVEYFDDTVNMDRDNNILPYYDPENVIEYSRYRADRLNVPTVATEKGYVIRSDESGDEAEIVVMIVNGQTGDRKYILGSEAFFYIETEEDKVSIGDLNLWPLT